MSSRPESENVKSRYNGDSMVDSITNGYPKPHGGGSKLQAWNAKYAKSSFYLVLLLSTTNFQFA
jgi:hypothetical protein